VTTDGRFDVSLVEEYTERFTLSIGRSKLKVWGAVIERLSHVLTADWQVSNMARDKSMGVHHCFENGAVVFDLGATEKFAALRELVRRASVFQEIPDLPAFEEAVICRERLQSTGFGHGVAVAHGRIRELPRVLIGLGLSRHGIPFDSPDGKPVHLLFIVASPQHTSIDYLQALSTLVRVVRDCALRDSLLSAGDEAEIEKTIRGAFIHSLAHLEGTACSSAS
jgi:PTS system nitrogen regulatory IIA component